MKRSIVSIILIMALVGYIVSSGIALTLSNVIVRFESRSWSTQYGIVSSYIAIPKEPRSDVIAFMLPGFIEWKEQLKSISIELARLGIYSVSFDLIGHGGTTINFNVSYTYGESYDVVIGRLINYTVKIYRPLINRVVKEVLGKDNVKMIFIGHGTGSAILTAIALNDSRVIANVLISPTGFVDALLKKFNSTNPRNTLVIIGSFNWEEKGSIARKIMEYSGYKDFRIGKEYGDFSNGTAREVFVVEYSTDVINFYHGSVLQIVHEWVAKALGMNYFSMPYATFLLYLYLSALIFASIITVSIPFIISKKIGIISGGKRWPHVELRKRAIVSTIIWTILTFIPFVIIAIIFVIISTVFITIPVFLAVLVAYDITVVPVSVYLIIKWTGKSAREIIRELSLSIFENVESIIMGILMAIITFCLMYIILNNVMMSIEALLKSPYMIILVGFALLLHFFANLSYEFFFRRVVQEAFGGATLNAALITIILSTITRTLLIISFGIFFSYISGMLVFGALVIILLTVASLIVEGIAASSYYATRDIIPGSIANSVWTIFIVAISPIVYFEKLVIFSIAL